MSCCNGNKSQPLNALLKVVSEGETINAKAALLFSCPVTLAEITISNGGESRVISRENFAPQSFDLGGASFAIAGKFSAFSLTLESQGEAAPVLKLYAVDNCGNATTSRAAGQVTKAASRSMPASFEQVEEEAKPEAEEESPALSDTAKSPEEGKEVEELVKGLQDEKQKEPRRKRRRKKKSE
jgi:hypothetical protein